jgi:hypothetical protein
MKSSNGISLNSILRKEQRFKMISSPSSFVSDPSSFPSLPTWRKWIVSSESPKKIPTFYGLSGEKIHRIPFKSIAFLPSTMEPLQPHFWPLGVYKKLQTTLNRHFLRQGSYITSISAQCHFSEYLGHAEFESDEKLGGSHNIVTTLSHF